MKPFLGEDFLLETSTAQRLYHEYAADMPVYDYHCHLNPADLAANRQFADITEPWLGGDHYKWRAMRTHGVPEAYITGERTPREKFGKWAETVPFCLGNPLYHWTHLELRRYFGYGGLLNDKTAESVWQQCNEKLSQPDFSARGLVLRSNVNTLCTTDDPADTLEYHQALRSDKTFPVRVLPAFRPDKALQLAWDGFSGWVARLGAAAGVQINTFDDLCQALATRMDFFASLGCRLSDHALDPIEYAPGSATSVETAFQYGLAGDPADAADALAYRSALLLFLGREYARRGWVMQLHIGTQRNRSTRAMRTLGADTGFDCMDDLPFARHLTAYLDALDTADELPRTILYCLNPRDNEVLATVAGCYQGEGLPGKIQFGSGWWFNDQKDGMIRQLTALSNLTLLPHFVGMLTDSRSLLSYPRHEYFRRILCNLIGGWVEAGELPGDMELLGDTVRNISYNNAVRYFDGSHPDVAPFE